MKRLVVWAMVIASFGLLAESRGAIQPNLDNVYGHALELQAGNTYIWSGADTETSFLAKTYAVDAQSAPNYMAWTQDVANGRNLTLSSSSHWANGAVTHKITAPTDCVFTGGTIVFTGGGIWGGAPNFTLRTHSAYGNNGYGALDASQLGTIYSTDNHTFATDWTMHAWTVNIPQGASQFYVSVEAGADYHSTWGNSLEARNVTLEQNIRIQPNKDNLYGHTITLGSGSRTIWTQTNSKSEFLAVTYATDGQQADMQEWTQNEANYRPLHLATNNSTADGSVTWKFTAPAGHVFSGGTISLYGTTVWSGAKLALQAHSAYANNSNGYGGYIAGTGTLYGQDNRAPTAPWQWTTWTVNVPHHVSEFFVTAAVRDNWVEGWGQNLSANNITLQLESSLPPVSQPPSGSSLPESWGFWADNTSNTLAEFRTDPVDHILVRMGNSGAWELNPNTKFAVQPGQIWTFTAVIAARNLGWLISQGGGALNLVSFDSQNNLVSWAMAETWDSGTFAWKRQSLTVTIPEGVAFVSPRFRGIGGGEYFITQATFEQSGQPADLTIESTTLPPLENYTITIPISAAGTNSVYTPGNALQWTVAPGCTKTTNINYSIVNPYGAELTSGTVALRQSDTFTPPNPGYYELRVSGTLNESNMLATLSGLCGAGSIPYPSAWSIGRNPFGMSSGDATSLSRFGFTWTRPLYYNIVSGAHDTLPTDFVAYADAWAQKVTQGLPALGVNTVEVWNEPHNEIKPIEYNWSNSRMDSFVSMVQATREGARRTDPTVKIAVNWEYISSFRQFNDRGGTHLYDVMTLHPYSMGIWDNPPHPDSPEKAGLLEYLDTAHTLLNDYGIPNVEIWSTEFGWGTAAGYPQNVSELNQARYIVRSSLLQLAQGLTRVCPFMVGDVSFWGPMDGSCGLSRVDGTPKPSLVAYAVLAQTVDNLPYAGRFDLGIPNFAAFIFGNSSKSVLVLWSAADNQKVTLSLPRGLKTRVECFGRKTVLNNLTYANTIGRSPVYLVINNAPTDVAAALGKTLITGWPTGVFSGVTDSADVNPPDDFGAIDGDANYDGKVNFSDYLVLSQNFGKTNAAWEEGDFTKDLVVNFSDYLILSANFGTGGSVSDSQVAEFQAASADLMNSVQDAASTDSPTDPIHQTLPCTPLAMALMAVIGLAFCGVCSAVRE